MPEVLKVLQLVDENGMPQVEIGRRGVEPRLDPQRATFLQRTRKLGLELGPLDHFDGPAQNQLELPREFAHETPL